jgi:hypothetical protein
MFGGPLVPLLNKSDVFVGVLRAQRIEHPTSYEASLLNLCFPSHHLLAPIPELSRSTIPRKCPQFAAVSPSCAEAAGDRVVTRRHRPFPTGELVAGLPQMRVPPQTRPTL